MPAKPCPMCAQRSRVAFAPFCSSRCKDEDLRRWLLGAYRIPARPDLDPEDGERDPEEPEEEES